MAGVLLIGRRRVWRCPDCKERVHFLRPCHNCGLPAPGLRQSATFGGILVATLLVLVLGIALIGRLLDTDMAPEPEAPKTAAPDPAAKSKPKPPPEAVPTFPVFDR